MIEDKIKEWGVEVGEIAAYLSSEIHGNPAVSNHFRLLTPDMGRIEGCNLIAKWAIELERRASAGKWNEDLSFYEEVELFLQEKFMELIRRDPKQAMWNFTSPRER